MRSKFRRSFLMICISPKELHSFLKAKGVEYLYFSSTVKNICSMIQSNTLMSLLQLSLSELPMTPVENPTLYKQNCMWNKISLYLSNLHGYFARQNKNGPVCLKISIDFLLEVHERDLYISKRNPLNWKKKLTTTDICYSSVSEFSESFNSLYDERKIHKNIILIRDKKTQIDLSKHLKEISLDYLGTRHLLFKKAQKSLTDALNGSNLNHIPVKTIKCTDHCFCQTNYDEMSKDELENLFLPQ